MKKQNTETAETISGRRNFLNWIWACLGVAAVAEILWAAVSFLRPQASEIPRQNSDPRVTAGPVNAFGIGTVTAFPRGRFYLTRLEDGGFLALSRKCTHLGCTIPWIGEEKSFICPCHASMFDIRGAVVHSPASRALDHFPVSIENGIVRVDTRRSIKRSGFSKEQVVYPDRQPRQTRKTI
jgi:cytochrome b6-f complex iron-sulfur subunit